MKKINETYIGTKTGGIWEYTGMQKRYVIKSDTPYGDFSVEND